MIGSRLSDPNKVCPPGVSFEALQQKVSECMTRMYRRPENGGNPFLYFYSVSREHKLAVKIGDHPINTAATNGKEYFWNPVFLNSLTPDELTTVMFHENFHVVLFHSSRGTFKQHPVWNWAIDYVVNACIIHDHEMTHRKGTLFGGNIGNPLLFADLLAFIDGKKEPPDKCCFADKSLYGRSPESIYDEIIDHWNKSPRKCPKCGGLSLGPDGKKKDKGDGQKGQKPGQKGQKPGQGDGDEQQNGQGQGDGDEQQNGQGQGQPGDGGEDECGCGKCDHCGSSFHGFGGMDDHIKVTATKEEIHAKLMEARNNSLQMRGTCPAEVEGVLGELQNPVISFVDIIRNCFFRKQIGDGQNNDWKRMRRRYLATDPPQFLPRHYTHRPRWVTFVDTSGSMSDQDIAFGVSQLQVLGHNTDGVVVPMDAVPHWKSAVHLDGASKEKLKRIKIVGRGGTVFVDAFKDLKRELGTGWDVVVVITDGYCDQIPIQYHPRCDVVWVLTSGIKNFKPTFGRVVELRHERI